MSESRQYESGSVVLPGYGPLLMLDSREVFSPEEPAKIISSQSGEGKTVTAIDMVYANRENATGITYITDSYQSAANAYLRAMIPEIFVKNWSLEMLCRLWGDVLQRGLSLSNNLEDRALDQFLTARCPHDATLEREMADIEKLVMDNAALFPEVKSGKAAIAAHKKLIKINFIRRNFHLDDRSLSDNERDLVRATRSSKPCHIIVCDDVTANVRTPFSGNIDVPSVGEGNRLIYNSLKGKKAAEYLYINILTLARHFAVVGFFVHTFDCFEPAVRSQFGAIVIMGQDSVTQICREHTLGPTDKDLLIAAWEVAANYKYHKVVLYMNPDLTRHHQRVAIFRPTYYDHPLELGVPTFRAVIRNISMAIENYRGGEIHRTRVKVARKSIEEEQDALAAEGNSRPSDLGWLDTRDQSSVLQLNPDMTSLNDLL